MKARFIEGDNDKLGLSFEPEDANERLLLKAFDQQARVSLGHLVISGWNYGGSDPGLHSIRIYDDKPPTVEIMDVPDKSVEIIEELRNKIESLTQDLADEKMISQALQKGLIAARRLQVVDDGQHAHSVRGVRVDDAFKFKKAPPGWTSGNLLVVDKMPGYAAPEGWDYFPIELLDGEIEMVPNTLIRSIILGFGDSTAHVGDLSGSNISISLREQRDRIIAGLTPREREVLQERFPNHDLISLAELRHDPEPLRKCMECTQIKARAPECKCDGWVCADCCDCGAAK